MLYKKWISEAVTKIKTKSKVSSFKFFLVRVFYSVNLGIQSEYGKCGSEEVPLMTLLSKLLKIKSIYIFFIQDETKIK